MFLTSSGEVLANEEADVVVGFDEAFGVRIALVVAWDEWVEEWGEVRREEEEEMEDETNEEEEDAWGKSVDEASDDMRDEDTEEVADEEAFVVTAEGVTAVMHDDVK